MDAIVILPTYNERDNIKSLVDEVVKIDRVLIVIVDDNSPDGTGEIADELAKANPDRIRVIHRKERGRGMAGLAGFRYALTQDVDYIIEMDADFSHDPADIPRFLAMAVKYDVVIGSRYIRGGKDLNRTFVRSLISRIASVYTRLILGSAIKDWSGGYKCYTKQALASLDFSTFHSHGFGIGMETLYRLKRMGFSFVEIPITFKDRRKGRSKFSWRQIVDYLTISLRLKLESVRLLGK